MREDFGISRIIVALQSNDSRFRRGARSMCGAIAHIAEGYGVDEVAICSASDQWQAREESYELLGDFWNLRDD